MPGLSREKKWHFTPTLSDGAKVGSGDIIGEVQETTLVLHKIMVPPGIEGTLQRINEGDYTVVETVAVVVADDGSETELKLMQKCPVRNPRQTDKRLAPNKILITGQRVVDTFFPNHQGRYGLCARTLRNRKNRCPASVG